MSARLSAANFDSLRNKTPPLNLTIGAAEDAAPKDMENEMRKVAVGLAALALTCSAGLAFAQTASPATEPAAEKPMTSTSTQTEKPPLAGANSFTESQAIERIKDAGFQEVKSLKKDDKGVWRGQALKSGQSVEVALDFRGNVVQQ